MPLVPAGFETVGNGKGRITVKTTDKRILANLVILAMYFGLFIFASMSGETARVRELVEVIAVIGVVDKMAAMFFLLEKSMEENRANSTRAMAALAGLKRQVDRVFPTS